MTIANVDSDPGQEVMYGAMRAGVVPVPLNTKLGADTLEYTIKDAACVGAVVEPGANPRMVGLVDALKLKAKLAFDPVPAGWLDYERELARVAPEFGAIRFVRSLF